MLARWLPLWANRTTWCASKEWVMLVCHACALLVRCCCWWCLCYLFMHANLHDVLDAIATSCFRPILQSPHHHPTSHCHHILRSCGVWNSYLAIELYACLCVCVIKIIDYLYNMKNIVFSLTHNIHTKIDIKISQIITLN